MRKEDNQGGAAHARKSELIPITAFAAAVALGGVRSTAKGNAGHAVWMFAASAALLLAGLLSRSFARRFYRIWMGFARVLGAVNSYLILSLVYVIGFGAYGLIGRLFGRDPLARRAPARESYWVMRARTRQQIWQFERQY
jgi:hypothetical protein